MQKFHDFPPLFLSPLTTTSPAIYVTHYTICGKSIIQFEGVLLYNLWICAAPSRRTCQTCQTCRTIRTGWGGGLEGWGKIKKDWKSDDFQSFGVPKKGLEPSRLAAHAPEPCASTIPPLGHFANAKLAIFF